MSSDAEYYYTDGDKQVGPFELEKLVELAKGGIIPADTLVTANGDDTSTPLNTLTEILSSDTEQAEADLTAEPNAVWEAALTLLDRISALPRLKTVPWRRVLDQVCKKHPEAEADKLFNSQTSKPGTPWVFSRILFYGFAAATLLLWALTNFGNPILIPGFMFFSCTVVPVATFLFLIELCGADKATPYRLVRAFLFGGVWSLIISSILYQIVGDGPGSLLGASIAGPIEETGKLLAAILIARKWCDSRRVRDGILIGAAIGTGFAVFETAGYLLDAFFLEINFFNKNDNWDGSVLASVLIGRAVLSPFCHVIWTAITVGALWRAAAGQPISINVLKDFRFLRFFYLAIALHMIWNSNFGIPLMGDAWGYLAKFPVLGFVGWYALLQLYLCKQPTAPAPTRAPETPPVTQPETLTEQAEEST